MDDLMVVKYVVDEQYMLGAFFVKSNKTGEEFVVEPTDKRFVLYFDPELFHWMIDYTDTLKYDNDEERWVTREGNTRSLQS